MSLIHDIESIPRKSAVVFLLLDNSPSLTPQKRQVYDNAVDELKAVLEKQNEDDSCCIIKIEQIEDSSISAMSLTLNNMLSKKNYMSGITGYYPPVIVFFSSSNFLAVDTAGERQDVDNAIVQLHKNNWFKHADVCAVALGKDTDRTLLAQWAAGDENVLDANSPAALKRIVASINAPRFSMFFEPPLQAFAVQAVPPQQKAAQSPSKAAPPAFSPNAPTNPQAAPPTVSMSANPPSSAHAQIAVNYKKELSRTFITLSSGKINEYMARDTYHVTRKYDGIMCVVFYENGAVSAYNSGGNALPPLPCLDETAALLAKTGIQNAVFGAELYADESRGRTHVFDTIAALATPQKHSVLRLAFFDIISINGAEWKKPYDDTITALRNYFCKGVNAAPVLCEKAESKEKVHELFARWVTEEGGEGLVVRKGERLAIKIKPRFSVDVAVVGFSECDGGGAVRTLLYALRREDGGFQIIGRTGNGLKQEERQSLYARLMPLKITSNYIEVDSNRAVFHIIKPCLVVELNANDVLAETTNGAIKNPLLELNGNAFKNAGQVSGYSLVGAAIERFRDDKKCDVQSVCIAQIESRAYNPQKENAKAAPKKLPPSTVLVREVYKKESQAVMVMKFIAWKTNKETWDNYPAYVFSYTNFSSGRAEPLSLDVRVSSSEKQIMSIYRDFVAKNVKTGWIRV